MGHDHRTVAANDNVKQKSASSATTKGTTNIFIPMDNDNEDDDEPIPTSTQLTGDTPLMDDDNDDDDTFDADADEHILSADELKKMVTRSPTTSKPKRRHTAVASPP